MFWGGSAKSSSRAPVDSGSFSDRQHLRLVLGQRNPKAAALSKAEARAALHGARSSWNQQGELPRPESANCPIFLWRRAGVKWPRLLCRPLDRCRPGTLSNAVPACGVALISSSGPATRTQSMCQCEQCGRNYADHRPKGLSCISGAADGGLFRCLLRGGYKAGRVLLRWAPPYLFAANT